MNQDAINLSVLGLSVDFKPGADMRRVQEAVQLLEERYADQEQRFSKRQTKDILLTFLALGLADDLLQAQKELAALRHGVHGLLSRIEESA